MYLKLSPKKCFKVHLLWVSKILQLQVKFDTLDSRSRENLELKSCVILHFSKLPSCLVSNSKKSSFEADIIISTL